MDYPRRDTNAVGGGMTALLIALGFVAILLVAFGVTGALRNSDPAAVTTPAVQPAPAPTAPAPTPPAATGTPATAPATELPPVKEPDVPTRSEQPDDAVDTAPPTPPQSEPGKPSPNVPAPAPAP